MHHRQLNKCMDSIIRSSITEPFDPSTLKAEVKNATIGQLVEMLRNDLIDLNPDFQRHANLWDTKRKSQLIESILLGLPLPSFYFYNDSNSKKWVVIDGLQRLCSLKSFMVDEDLTLRGLEFLDEKKYGVPYKSFSYYDKLAISMHSVTLNVLSGNASAEARYIIFQRVNSKGTPLTPVEIRNALYQGKATDLISYMVKLDVFKMMVSQKISVNRMKDREFASRFLAFYLNDYHDYADFKSLDVLISNTMDAINKTFNDNQVMEVVSLFELSIKVCKRLLGEDAFRKPTSGQRRNQVSLAIFEMLTVSIAHLDKVQQQKLINRRQAFNYLYNDLFDDQLMQKYLSSGMGNNIAVRYRFDKITQIIEKTLTNQ